MDYKLPAGQFKATCLKLMDEVESKGRTYVITKRGRPVAKLVPATPVGGRQPLFGALKHLIEIVGDIESPPGEFDYDTARKWDRLEREADARVARKGTRRRSSR